MAAKADLMAGFTAERDMGTEGAGPADTAVRNAINKGQIPGPRLRVSGNAINILGGHEDSIGFNPEQHVLPNATYANTGDELVAVIRQQIKDGADFIKIYETGSDFFKDGQFHTIVQYTEPQLAQAVAEAARLQTRIAVHCEGEPGALYAAQAGVASIDHADQLSDETMRLMRERRIYAVPTFTIQEYFAAHEPPEEAAQEHQLLDYHVQQFHVQLAHGVPMAVGSDVGPFPHGTQARELELMVQYGMKPLEALQADLLNGARLLDWEHDLGSAQSRLQRRHHRRARQSSRRHPRARACLLRNEGRRNLPPLKGTGLQSLREGPKGLTSGSLTKAGIPRLLTASALDASTVKGQEQWFPTSRKNTSRDVGHPALVREPHSNQQFSRRL